MPKMINYTANDKFVINTVLDMVIKAQHFVLPNDGKILANGYHGIKGELLHLPYPSITIETFTPPDDIIKTYYKQVFLATELPSREAYLGQISEEEEGGHSRIAIVSLIAYGNGNWSVLPVGVILNREWDKIPIDHGINRNAQTQLILPEVFHNAYYTEEMRTKAYEAMSGQCGRAIRTVLELCEALSCQNISEIVYQEGSKPRTTKVKSNKPPLWETKSLVINITKKERVTSGLKITDRKKPYQHLRRGHIRRFKNGNKIWINNMVIAADNGPLIDKNYKIKH